MEGTIKLLGVLALVLLSGPGIAIAQEAVELSAAERNSVWFIPALVTNADPICASILRAERNLFFSPDAAAYEDEGFKKIRGVYVDPVEEDSQVEKVADDPYQLILRLRGEERVFTYFNRYGGCGGYCETEQVLVAGAAISRQPHEHTFPATPAADRWRLYKSADGEFYVMAAVQDRWQVHRIAGSSRLELACEVLLKPEMSADSADAAVRRAWLSTEALMMARGPLAPTDGNCGSMATASRWHESTREALEEALYRPWKVAVPVPLTPSDNSWGSDERIEDQLGLWSLGGIAEHRALNRYRQQREQTIATLADFYGERFGWTKARSAKTATSAVSAALSIGFGFYAYEPYRLERGLRQAILERRSMAAIRAIEFDYAALEQTDTMDQVDDSDDLADSILNVAIEYPEALQFLLEKGFDPNAKNAFGKTPLMYAAQYNQLDSTKLLLAAGADTNAATFVPQDTCTYTLKTSGMTALHYAARYASASLIQLLVAHEAITFRTAQGKNSEYRDVEEYPLDWLKRYAAEGAQAERNTNIAAAELPALSDLLRVPSTAERERLAVRWLSRAQAHYARSEFELAYSRLQIALAAQPDNAKALADLPLVAMKAGHLSAAVDAANRAIRELKEPTLQAAAWFNKGLACEQLASMRDVGGSCDDDWIYPFIQAWTLHPTAARGNKLKQLFDKDGAGACRPRGSRARIWSLQLGFKRNYAPRVYILHPVGDVLELNPPEGAQEQPVGLELVRRLVIGDTALTVLEGGPGSAAPGLREQPCRIPTISPASR